jgi:hypothetical protein
MKMTEENEVKCGGIHCRTCEFQDDCGFHYHKDEWPYSCPQCDNEEVSHKPHEAYDRAMISVSWSCSECGFKWLEIYKFLEWER